MLTHLQIRNFAIAQEIDLELAPGMTVITGETGAGKSIMLDALGYALGNRAGANIVRNGAARAEICATFQVTGLDDVKDWLVQQELSEGDDCVLRRVITAEGRSRGFINGQAVPVQQLKQLGDMLLDLQSQHEHYSLLKPETHRLFLDDFGGHQALVNQVKASYQSWRTLNNRIQAAKASAQDREDRAQLIRYQVDELETLALEPGEVEALETEQKQLANAEQILAAVFQVTQWCEGQDFQENSGLINQLQQTSHLLAPLQVESLSEPTQLLEAAAIQVQEAVHSLNHFTDQFSLDEGRLNLVNERLSLCFDLARKHQVEAHQLYDTFQELQLELNSLEDQSDSLSQWDQELAELHNAHLLLCQKLSQKRKKAAKAFDKLVTEQMQNLSLNGALLKTQLQPLATDRFSAFGMEEVEFLIVTNPGQPAQSLAKIASGGELSRISLAIQVISAENSRIPTLVLDEVDVGISGGTSELVGRLLRHLGEQGQVLCVTHQPQVACQGHQHLQVRKTTSQKSTLVEITPLEEDQRTQEVARLLGGVTITEQTLAHAEEMVNLGQVAH